MPDLLLLGIGLMLTIGGGIAIKFHGEDRLLAIAGIIVCIPGIVITALSFTV